MNMVAAEFTKYTKSCETGWDKFWHDVKTDVVEMIHIANLICKYIPEIMEGTAVVGAEEAEPIEAVLEGECIGVKIAEEALKVVTVMNDAEGCAHLSYDVE